MSRAPNPRKSSQEDLTTPTYPTESTSGGASSQPFSMVDTTSDMTRPITWTISGESYNIIIEDGHGNTLPRVALEVGEKGSLIHPNLVRDLGADPLPVPPSSLGLYSTPAGDLPLQGFTFVEAIGAKTASAEVTTLAFGIPDQRAFAPGIDVCIGGNAQSKIGRMHMLRRALYGAVHQTGVQRARATCQSSEDRLTQISSSTGGPPNDFGGITLGRNSQGATVGGGPPTDMQCLRCDGLLAPRGSPKSNSAGGRTLSSLPDVQRSSPPTSVDLDNMSLCSCEVSTYGLDPGTAARALDNQDSLDEQSLTPQSFR
ncbi:hypothetical protein K456DRAFT_48459 [Colletotrichum gloeosporioides 23]|nr:hypothetical protein K456DRAFT_48459 [Colletotrichum gloeosporioides 23]